MGRLYPVFVDSISLFSPCYPTQKWKNPHHWHWHCFFSLNIHLTVPRLTRMVAVYLHHDWAMYPFCLHDVFNNRQSSWSAKLLGWWKSMVFCSYMVRHFHHQLILSPHWIHPLNISSKYIISLARGTRLTYMLAISTLGVAYPAPGCDGCILTWMATISWILLILVIVFNGGQRHGCK